MYIPPDFLGDSIKPGDSNYHQFSAVFAAKGAPALILRPYSAADVAAAIKCGIDNHLVISVRSGGHSVAGFSTNKGGLVIDVRYLNHIKVLDRKERVVRVGAGATWAEVAEAIQPFGWAISSGDTKTVGVSGLTLGGGIGWMVRKYGLTIDSLVAVELVTSDGQILHASKTEHEDLFWAVRGGGGNFGIVTNFEFAAHAVAEVYAGTITYESDSLAVLLKGWRDSMRIAPAELTTTFLVMPAFGKKLASATITCVYAGDDHDKAMQAIEPLLHLDNTLLPKHDIVKKPYASVLEDVAMPSGAKILVNNTFIRELSNELINTIARQKGQVFQIRSIGGAMNQVAADATAFAHRSSEAFIICPAFIAQDASPDDIETTLKPWHEVASFGQGAYSNFFSEVTKQTIAAIYPVATRERLARIKAKYDPHNIFNQNFNIKPSKK